MEQNRKQGKSYGVKEDEDNMELVNGIYDQIEILPYSLKVIQEFEIVRGINTHDKARVKGIISEETLNMYEYTMGSGSCVTLSFVQDGKKHLLFSGFLEELEVQVEGDQRTVIIQLSGLTKAMDRKKKCIDYQWEQKKKSSFIENAMVSYQNVCYENLCKDKTIPEFVLQYEETDFEFLKRILSLDGELIYTVMEGEQGKIHYGSYKKNTTTELKLPDYQISFKNYLQYKIESNQFLDIGTKVKTPIGNLVVEKSVYSLKEGKSRNWYVLCGERDFSVSTIYNSKLVGISLDGTIKDRKRDKVKIELNVTPETGEQKRRWFSYSSVASSGDGSGWYCMPEEGEEIRLLLPTELEEEAYVISAIRSDSGGYASNATGSREPANKSLSNVQGQEVNFTADGVTLNCAGNVTSMKLTKDGEITITAINDIEIASDNQVNIRAEQGIVIMAKEGITLQNEAGGSFEMAENIDIHANRIKNNC